MREYELVFLVADNVAEDKQAAVLAKVEKFIADGKGEILKKENLGRRRLAYEIQKNEFATYHVLNFKVEGSELKEIDHDIRLTQEIIRHLIVLRKVEHVSVLDEKLVVTSEEDIEKAIGEKSIEQVEGETEASYELMAKRDKEEIEEPEAETVETKTEEPVAEETKETEVEVVAEPVKKPRAKKASQSEISPREVTEPKEVAEETVKAVEEPEKEEKKVAKVEKPAKKAATAKPKKDTKVEDEADRLKKLDDKLADILGDDL